MASPFVTPNSEYVVGATRFSVPSPQQDVPIATAKESFAGLLSFVKVDPKGPMSLAFQIRMPGYSYDLAHAGKGPSAGWAFFTTYNTEQAFTLLERGASQKDKDFVVNRGHYFGTGVFKEETPLSDEDKRALIEFLKTF